ncbi:4-phosphoerythronate dehydrogenase [Paraferrimonas sp. SM1919]|uniref:4-phosphoerythronate dehydrogenase n=1 Tax=Paraferrimonas sp. SM1919 TaxID=2662263 RepID=UPI0013CFE238|nr:4-phosphoerythronate dehydrogenase [Paraferrimonas sp. SM1919]
MKILIDENMPYAEQIFSPLAEVITKNGRNIKATDLIDIDILLIRSVTVVDETLLELANKLKYVGTATIGMDHLDTNALQQRGIAYSNAPGCNALGVGEYSVTAFLELCQRTQTQPQDKKVGIIGLGNTGSAAQKCYQALGIETLLYDPYKANTDPDNDYQDWQTLINEADVLSLHVPLTDETFHMFDAQQLEALAQDVWLINCCRGDVIDNQAVLDWKHKRPQAKLVLDVWHNEPNPIPELIPLVDIATPHIAGYSVEGKARGTLMLYDWLQGFYDWPATPSLASLLPGAGIPKVAITGPLDLRQLNALINLGYDIKHDDWLFRQYACRPGGFDQLRKKHTYRREFSAITIDQTSLPAELEYLFNFGFTRG